MTKIPTFQGITWKEGQRTFESFVVCRCGAWWKDHRFVDGACPPKQPKPLEKP